MVSLRPYAGAWLGLRRGSTSRWIVWVSEIEVDGFACASEGPEARWWLAGKFRSAIPEHELQTCCDSPASRDADALCDA